MKQINITARMAARFRRKVVNLDFRRSKDTAPLVSVGERVLLVFRDEEFEAEVVGFGASEGEVRILDVLPCPTEQPSRFRNQECDDENCPGYMIDQDTGLIERCLTCEVFKTDDEAAEYLPALKAAYAFSRDQYFANREVLEHDALHANHLRKLKEVACGLVGAYSRGAESGAVAWEDLDKVHALACEVCGEIKEDA